uniref:Uncharacterized protein n=1 Tax=Timema cristinae TaxID=61476 RepID=A0A7R9H4T7_TIMCR|nr:unnamed protein product [Timema cristinae]
MDLILLQLLVISQYIQMTMDIDCCEAPQDKAVIRNTELFVKAAHTCKTPLKLCKHREISATAAHFSIAAIREVMFDLRTISDTTNWDICGDSNVT